jgi:D-alanyl-D-alanine carboxypeptidase
MTNTNVRIRIPIPKHPRADYIRSIERINEELGINLQLIYDRGLTLQEECLVCQDNIPDVFGRMLSMHPLAFRNWNHMRLAAAHAGLSLALCSAFRSVNYQKMLIQRKLSQGESLKRILTVVAPPGFSEHHTGRALDITTPALKSLEENFEDTPEFHWLLKNSKRYGFYLSYPRDNRCGIQYEPWHWLFKL